MDNLPQIHSELRENWFIKRIKKYQIITFTFGFLLLYRFTTCLIGYFADKDLSNLPENPELLNSGMNGARSEA